MKKIDITKPVRFVGYARSRQDLNVKIITDKARLWRPHRGNCNLAGYLDENSDCMTYWDEYGHHYIDSYFNIENVQEKTVKYLNMFSDGSYCIHITKDIADKFAGPNRLSCIRIEYEEGQFDE